jgi:hypothetical protein
VATALGAPAIGPQASTKAVVIFGEPSHFASAFLPLLLFRAATSSRRRQFALIGMSLVLAALLQSMTMIAGILVVSLLLLRRAAVVLMLLAAGGGMLLLDLTYYVDRLNFSAETDNISTLVFLQGWQNAILNFQETHGIGVGFQQFGVAGSMGDIAEKIAKMLGAYINIYDGGSTSTKLIAEFGVLGLIAILLFLQFAVRCALYIRSANETFEDRDAHRIFFYALIVNYTFELLLRGSGYYTPGAFLMLVALISSGRLARQSTLPTAAAPGTDVALTIRQPSA